MRESWVFDLKRGPKLPGCTPSWNLSLSSPWVERRVWPGLSACAGAPSWWPGVPELPGRPQLVPLLTGYSRTINTNWTCWGSGFSDLVLGPEWPSGELPRL